MKVAVIGRSTEDGSFVGHIAADAERLGHESSRHQLRLAFEPRRGRLANVAGVIRADVVSRSRRAMDVMYRPMLRGLAEAQPDLIITTLGRMGRSEVESWREAAPGARIVLWFPDALSNFGAQQAFVAGFDRIYVKDPYLVHRVGRQGGVSELRYLPEGAPSEVADWAAGRGERTRSSAIAMVGNIYPTRYRFLEQLVDLAEVEIYGSMNTKHVSPRVADRFTGKYLWSTDKYEHFRNARAVLNNLHYAEVESVNYRLFEAAGCGGVVATDDVAQIPRYLEPSSECIVFDSPSALVNQLNGMSESDLDGVGDRARRRVASSHLIRHRLAEMFDDLGMA